jgi:hypothetical protein
MRQTAKDLAFWGAVALAGVAGLGLFKFAVARLPVPDGLNRFAASL